MFDTVAKDINKNNYQEWFGDAVTAEFQYEHVFNPNR